MNRRDVPPRLPERAAILLLAACGAVALLTARSSPAEAAPDFSAFAAADIRLAVQRALAEKDPRDRIRAVQAAVEGADSADAARALVDLVFREAQPQPVLDVAVLALARMRDADALGAMEKAATTAPRRLLVVEALGRSESPGAAAALAGFLADKDPRVRAAAVSAYADRSDAGPPDAGRRDGLRTALSDEEWTVRAAATRGIGRLGDRSLGRDLTWAMRRASGREIDDIEAALVQLTGKRFGPDPGAYERLWDPPIEGAVWKAPPTSFASPLVTTRSERILFVLQTSETMRDPVGVGAEDSDVVKSVAAAGEDLAEELRAAKTKLEVARVHLRAMLRTLRDGVRFDVMTYTGSATFAFGSLTAADDSSRRRAESRIARLSPGGQPDIAEAVLRIYDPKGKDAVVAPDGPDTVIFFTDGALPTTGENDRAEIISRVARWARARQVRFHVIAVGQNDASVVGALSGGPPPGTMQTIP